MTPTLEPKTPMYRRLEAARLLDVEDSWLKRMITERLVPFCMTGATGQRGVRFTEEQIDEIRRDLPRLMKPRARKGPGRSERSSGVAAVSVDELMAEFTALKR